MKDGIMYFFTTGLKGLIEQRLEQLRNDPMAANHFINQMA